MSFLEIANERGLRSVADHLGELTWEVEPDGYQRAKVPGSADVDPLLRLALRRGLEPALASLLLDRFETRPLERALIAWDIAAGSLLGAADRALVERLPAVLAPLKALGTSSSAAIPTAAVPGLIEAAAAGDRAMPESLAAVTAIRSTDAAAIDAAVAFADRLARAHLPSLALAILQILWERHAVQPALDRLLEVALDHDRLDAIPPVTGDTSRAVQRQTYIALRICLARLDTQSAASVVEQMREHPAIAGLLDPALSVAAMELVLLDDQPIDPAWVTRIETIAPADSTWRYASRVAAAIQIARAPDDAPIWVESFLTSFGNDMRLWAAAAYRNVARAPLLALVSRELRYGAHDPEAWRALGMFLDDGMPIEVELQERSAAQLAAALA